MASRLNLAPVFRAHWRGLSMRRKNADGGLDYQPDIVSRLLTLAIPSAAAAGMLFWLRDVDKTWSLPPEFAGVAIAAAALTSAALVQAFTQLASWRIRLTDRNRPTEAPFRAMVDEAVSHVLLATLESVLIVASAAGSLMLAGWAARLCTALTCALTAHLLFLFVLLVPRLYSTYVQTSEVDERLDGYTRARS